MCCLFGMLVFIMNTYGRIIEFPNNPFRDHTYHNNRLKTKSSLLTVPTSKTEKMNSHTGTRTRVAEVKTRYPNRLDYMGPVMRGITDYLTNSNGWKTDMRIDN